MIDLHNDKAYYNSLAFSNWNVLSIFECLWYVCYFKRESKNNLLKLFAFVVGPPRSFQIKASLFACIEIHKYSSTVTLPKALNPGENTYMYFVIGECNENTKSKPHFLACFFHFIQHSAVSTDKLKMTGFFARIWGFRQGNGMHKHWNLLTGKEMQYLLLSDTDDFTSGSGGYLHPQILTQYLL